MFNKWYNLYFDKTVQLINFRISYRYVALNKSIYQMVHNYFDQFKFKVGTV